MTASGGGNMRNEGGNRSGLRSISCDIARALGGLAVAPAREEKMDQDQSFDFARFRFRKTADSRIDQAARQRFPSYATLRTISGHGICYVFMVRFHIKGPTASLSASQPQSRVNERFG
jgi:hypothetical protein